MAGCSRDLPQCRAERTTKVWGERLKTGALDTGFALGIVVRGEGVCYLNRKQMGQEALSLGSRSPFETEVE